MNSKTNIEQFVERNVSEYKKFIGIESFPDFQLIEKHISLDGMQKKGFESIASYKYNFSTGRHELTVSDTVLSYNDDPAIYHELTHLLDESIFCKEDRAKYVENHGCSEFHASQIELLKILGANYIEENLHFSMEKEIEVQGDIETVREFMIAPYNNAKDILTQNDFPADFEALSVVLGLLFNYWGRRSICAIGATDYNPEDTNLDMSVFRKFFSVNGIDLIKEWNDSLYGWLNAQQIEKIGKRYGSLLTYFTKRFKLN